MEIPPHILYTCGSQELKAQIISEVKVEKMAIEVDVQTCMTITGFGGQGFAAPGCVG